MSRTDSLRYGQPTNRPGPRRLAGTPDASAPTADAGDPQEHRSKLPAGCRARNTFGMLTVSARVAGGPARGQYVTVTLESSIKLCIIIFRRISWIIVIIHEMAVAVFLATAPTDAKSR